MRARAQEKWSISIRIPLKNKNSRDAKKNDKVFHSKRKCLNTLQKHVLKILMVIKSNSGKTVFIVLSLSIKASMGTGMAGNDIEDLTLDIGSICSDWQQLIHLSGENSTWAV